MSPELSLVIDAVAPLQFAEDGVIVVQALSERFMGGDERRVYLNSLLEYVALGTVADMAPMMGENRILTRRGMQVLENSERHGIRALKAISGTKGKIDSTSIGFFLGPRINCAGRIGKADLALDLLRATNATDAARLAEQLNALNVQRQELQRTGIEDAEAQVIEHHAIAVISREPDAKRKAIMEAMEN